MSGNSRSFALNHTRRNWNLNLQPVKVVLPSGQIKKVKVSVKTLRTLNKKKINNIKKAPNIKKNKNLVNNVVNTNIPKNDEIKKIEKVKLKSTSSPQTTKNT